MSADLYGGNWSFVDTSGAESRVEKTLGGQLFLDTPVQGLRFRRAAGGQKKLGERDATFD